MLLTAYRTDLSTEGPWQGRYNGDAMPAFRLLVCNTLTRHRSLLLRTYTPPETYTGDSLDVRVTRLLQFLGRENAVFRNST